MRAFYENFRQDLEIEEKNSSHFPPHLHKSIEFVYVIEGTLELGMGQELYHMETNDFAIIFPDVIHHYQVFTPDSRAIYLLAAPSLAGSYYQQLLYSCPKTPVISSCNVHPDIPYMLDRLLHCSDDPEHSVLWQSYTQIILARSFPFLDFMEKSTIQKGDVIYSTISFIAAHFTDNISLTDIAESLGYSPYAISRVFSGTFHCNFNTYVNHMRLEYACNLLLHTDKTITEICENSGFNSQRTFNRVFFEQFKMSPRDYRNFMNR